MIRAGGGGAGFFPVDVTDEQQVERLVAAVVSRFGSDNTVYDKAGGEGPRVRLHETSTGHWRRVMQTNVDSGFFYMKHELAHTVEHGGGVIVNASPTFGLAVVPEGPTRGAGTPSSA